MPEALSERKGEFSNFSFSATAEMISGRRGTNKKATENPIAASPTKVNQSF